MIKDIVLKCSIFAFLLLAPFTYVYADEGDTDEGNYIAGISYQIRTMELNVDSDTLTISGMAFKSGYNNNHGHISSISLVAVDANNPSNRISANSFSLKNDNKNYYELNCYAEGGPSPKGCLAENSTSCSHNGDCILKNLDFTGKFKLSTLKAKGSDFYFEIVIGVNSNNIYTNNARVGDNLGAINTTDSVEIAVYNGNCSIVNGGVRKGCSTGENKVTSTNSSMNLNLSGLSNSAYVTTSASKPQSRDNSGNYSCYGRGKNTSDYNCNCYYIAGQKLYLRDDMAPINGTFYGIPGNLFYPAVMDKRVLVGKFETNGHLKSEHNEYTNFSYNYEWISSYSNVDSAGYFPTYSHSASGCENALNSGVKYVSWSWIQLEGMVSLSFDDSTPPPQPVVTKTDNCDNPSISYSVRDVVKIETSRNYGEGMCNKTRSKYMYGYYRMYETSDIVYRFNKGPIYNGGYFDFRADFVNNAVWYYDESKTQSCPSIYIPSPYLHCTLYGCSCRGSANLSPDTVYGTNLGSYCPMSNKTEAKKYYEEQIAKKYSSTTIMSRSTNNNNKVTFKDSNTVGAGDNSSAGTWTCDEMLQNGMAIGGSWYKTWGPNVQRIVNCRYVLKNAYINKQTSFVSYYDSVVPSELDKYIVKKDSVYFIPLRWKEQYFTFKTSFNQLGSLVRNTSWSLGDTCKVETMQRIYDEERTNRSKYVKENGIPSSEVSFMYYYRPIQLTTPFPGRDASSNWITWIKDNKNKERLLKTYTNGKMEYKFSLDSDTISDIIEYNRTKLSNGRGKGYLDYDELSMDGKSSFIGGIIKNQSTDLIEHYRLGMVSE